MPSCLLSPDLGRGEYKLEMPHIVLAFACPHMDKSASWQVNSGERGALGPRLKACDQKQD